jgi:prophage regulatory protein
MICIKDIPASGFLRESDLVGVARVSADRASQNRAKGSGIRRAREARRGLLPFSTATLWRKVVAGQFPAPVKLSSRVTAWRCEDVHAWMEQLNHSQRKVA